MTTQNAPFTLLKAVLGEEYHAYIPDANGWWRYVDYLEHEPRPGVSGLPHGWSSEYPVLVATTVSEAGFHHYFLNAEALLEFLLGALSRR